MKNNNLTIQDKWILNKCSNLVKNVRKHMDNYEFNVVGSELYSFVWDDFCDWYIELAKINMNNTTKSVLCRTLNQILKMLHPFMPYVTEEIYSLLPIKDAESIMIAPYPIYQEEFTFSSATILDDVIKFIVKVRNVKQEHQIPKDAKVYFKGDNADIILKLLKIDTESLVEDNNLDGIEIKDTNYEIKYIFDSSSIKEKEKENLLKEKERLEGAIKRRENLLSNENYVNKAPKNIVDLDRENLEKDKKELEIIMDKLNN